MNLMFWKKKPAAAEEAEEAGEDLAGNIESREPLDFMEQQQDAVEPEPGPEEPDFDEAEEEDQDASPEPGWAARLKSRFKALIQRFRKPQPFRAATDIAEETTAAEDEAEVDADVEPDMEAPVKLGLTMRMKMQLIAIVRRFRKKPESDDEQDEEESDEDASDEDERDEERAPVAPARPGLLKRLKVALAAFVREFKATAEPAADDETDEEETERDESGAEGELPVPAAEEPARPRRWLVIGGSIVIVILLLAHFAMFNMHLFEPAQKRWGTKHDQNDISSSRKLDDLMSGVYIPPGASPAEIDALIQKNAELQARVEALKKKPPLPPPPPSSQSTYAAPSLQTGGAGTVPFAASGGDLTVTTKDPKATAMTLKEAIEAMNASTGDYDNKPKK